MRHSDWEKVEKVSGRLGLEQMVTESIYLMESGCLAATYFLRGVSMCALSETDKDYFYRLWHQAIMSLDEHHAIWVTEYRHKESCHINTGGGHSFIDSLTQVEHHFYEQDLFLTVSYNPNKTISGKNSAAQLTEPVTAFETRLTMMESLLVDYGMSRLGVSERAGNKMTLFSVLGLLANGGYAPLSTIDAKSVSHAFCSSGLGHYISQHHVSIGSCIEYYGLDRTKRRVASILSVNDLPPETSMGHLSSLNKVPCDWLRIQTFEPIAQVDAEKQIKVQQSKLRTVSDSAKSQQEALERILDRVSSGQVALGYMQQAIVVFAEDEKSLSNNLSLVAACFTEAGFRCVREALGLEIAFWAYQYAHLNEGVRKILLSSENFAHIGGLTGHPTGHRGQNHIGREICLLETPQKTPYAFNCHVPSDSESPSLGHTLVIGSSNSGKTVFLTALDAWRSSLGGARFMFDRDRGCEMYFRAIEKPYFRMAPEMDWMRFNPFSLPGAESNRVFITEWLKELIRIDSQTVLASDVGRTFRFCVDYAYDALSPAQRTLTNALALLPSDFAHRKEINQWLNSGDKTEPAGEYARYFDNVNDGLSMSDVMGFDMTYILDSASDHLRRVLMMYLFYRIELQCTGQLVTITLDEGWQYFRDPCWQAKMRSWLPTLRKMNAHLIIATQSATSIVESAIRDMVLDNCATKLFFSNEQAQAALYRDELRLSDAEIEVIRGLKKQEYWMLLKHADETAIVRLNMSHARNQMPILSGHKGLQRRYDELPECHKESPDHWIPILLSNQGGSV